MKITKEVKKILNEGKDEDVRQLFSFDTKDSWELIYKKFILWSRWFFPKFFESEDAPFHKDMDLGNIRAYLGHNRDFLNIAFRGSAKTTRTKLFVAFAIANDVGNKRKYIKVLSRDGDNSRQIVTDIYNLLIAPSVESLYPEIFEKTTEKREERMSSFTTATGIKVVSGSVGMDQRGDIQDEARPDFLWYEDIETRVSLASATITHKIWENMEEARTGLSKDGSWVCTANYISERGNVHKLVQKTDHKVIIPIEENNKPTWSRYTFDEILHMRKYEDDYEGEYLCKPSASRDVFVDREAIERQVKREPIDVIAGLKMFKRYNSMHRIGSGHDVGGGVGLDHSTSVFMDFTTNPNQVIATYKSNEIRPDEFAHEIAKQCKHFGKNYVGVEKNYGSTIDILKTIYPTDKLHQTQRTGSKIDFQNPLEYGWTTSAATKPNMMMDLAHAIESGLLDLNDEDLISEARGYTRGDLMDKEVDPRLTTRHFDLLIACAICWQMRNFVKEPEMDQYADMDLMLARKIAQQKKKIENPAI